MKVAKSSRISGFHALSTEERLARVAGFCDLDKETVAQLRKYGDLDAELANRLIENVIGTISLPVGIATNMKIDGQDVLIPMATEESSVVAAVCNAGRQCYDNGGFATSSTGALMIAQVQLTQISDPQYARLQILEKEEEIKRICAACDPVLLEHGGGLQSIEVRVLTTATEPMVVLHLVVDVKDAMGANAVNSMAEAVAPFIEQWTGGQVLLRILSNLADRRLARARAVWGLDAIGGAAVRDGIISAYQMAQADPYRATTHNKGIMNGVSAVVLATGNDTRAIEAGAHAYAVKDGQYGSLTHWEVTAQGDLAGSIELPMAVGIIGGATRLHPTAQACLKILEVDSADRLMRIIAAVGLAQNFSALKALATTGIQKGHMALHAQNIAMLAGAQGEEIDRVAERMVQLETVRIDVARQIVSKLRQET